MKTVSRILGRFFRLGAGASVMLFSQLAFAVGTDPGVLVENTADVSYEVNSNPFTAPSTAADFVVDRRVDFTIARLGTGLTPTGLGDDNVFVDFVVTNLSNGDLDLALIAAQVLSTTEIYTGLDDNADIVIDSIEVAPGIDVTPGAGDGPDPVYGAGNTFIDNLPEDQSIRVRVYTDTPTTLVNGDIAGVELFATAADPTGAPGALLTESATWDAANIDNVFANLSGADTAGNATESDLDGYIVEAPQLVINKAAAVISDPINGATPAARAIPGAIIEYTVTIDNSAGDDSADAVSIVDDIDPDVTFVLGAANVTIFDGTTTTTCDAEAGGTDTNSDGCVFDSTVAGRLLVTSPALTTVGIGEVWTVSFRVEVPLL